MYAKDPAIGPIAGWPPHKSVNIIWCGYYDGNTKSKRVQEKVGFVYRHTCNEVPVPLLGEIRTGHTNYMSKEQWFANIEKVK